VQARIRRLDQLIHGVSTELVQRALGCEPFTQEECQAHCTAVEGMVHGTKAALAPLLAAVKRLTQEEGKGRYFLKANQDDRSIIYLE
jgi:hypothetical protein